MHTNPYANETTLPMAQPEQRVQLKGIPSGQLKKSRFFTYSIGYNLKNNIPKFNLLSQIDF